MEHHKNFARLVRRSFSVMADSKEKELEVKMKEEGDEKKKKGEEGGQRIPGRGIAMVQSP